MNNFLIGQYGIYDFDKFNRDFKKEFFGTEACLLGSETDIDHLIAESEKHNFKIGIHFPLRAGVHKYRDPLFMSNNEIFRCDAFESICSELNYIREKNIKINHIVFHYPKPVILNEEYNWSNWRFTNCKEFIYESEYTYDELSKGVNSFIAGCQRKAWNMIFCLCLSLMQ